MERYSYINLKEIILNQDLDDRIRMAALYRIKELDELIDIYRKLPHDPFDMDIMEELTTLIIDMEKAAK